MQQIETVYLDWQRCAHPLGEAYLIKKVRDGRTFILDDVDSTGMNIPENKQVVYTYEVWLVKFINLTELGERYVADPNFYIANIRKLYLIGLATATDQKDPWQWHGRLDKFLIVNNKEIY